MNKANFRRCQGVITNEREEIVKRTKSPGQEEEKKTRKKRKSAPASPPSPTPIPSSGKTEYGTKRWTKKPRLKQPYGLEVPVAIDGTKGISKYHPGYAEQAYRLALLGATIKELSEFFHVHEQTIHFWFQKYERFKKAFYSGKAEADAKVVERLYMRATGYSHPEEKVFCNHGEIIKTTVMKHHPPDTGAACFWLKNRRKGQWKDRHEHSIVPARVLEPIDLVPISDEELSEVVIEAGGPSFLDSWRGDDE